VKIEHTKMVRELLDYAKINDTFCLTTTQFREFENEVAEACEKQIGKKPIPLVTPDGDIDLCGVCESGVEDDWDGCPYCFNKIDWSEEE